MRAFVTGASLGIGRATALRLGKDGFDVALHGFHHPAETEAAATEVAGLGRESFVVRGDLSDLAEVRRVAGEVLHRWDRLDLLVLNAGAYPRGPFEELSESDWRGALDLNLVGPAILTRELLPALRRAVSPRIVFLSSVLAFTGSRHGAHYAAAKAGVLGLARSLARELAPQFTVNVVAPGSIDTSIIADDPPALRADRGRATPLGRVGRAEEVADAIAFLASPGATYITGATLHINGGLRFD